MDVRLAAGCKAVVVAGTLLTERTGGSKKTLRIGLPNHVRLDDGARISFDQGPPVRLPFVECYAIGKGDVCVAEYEVGAELIDQLKRGTMLVIEATSAAGAPMIYRLPLAGFAQAYEGPPVQPKVFEEQQGKLHEELDDAHEVNPR